MGRDGACFQRLEVLGKGRQSDLAGVVVFVLHFLEDLGDRVADKHPDDDELAACVFDVDDALDSDVVVEVLRCGKDMVVASSEEALDSVEGREGVSMRISASLALERLAGGAEASAEAKVSSWATASSARRCSSASETVVLGSQTFVLDSQGISRHGERVTNCAAASPLPAHTTDLVG